MNPETNIVDVPVYRVSFEAHEAAIENASDRFVSDIIDSPSVSPEMVEEERRRFYEEKAAPWLFNEIVGWVRIYALGTQIRGEYYFATGKKLCLAPQKRSIWPRGKAFEKGFSADSTNEQIGASVLDAVNGLKRDRPFRGRFIDITCLETICEYFDWRAVLING